MRLMAILALVVVLVGMLALGCGSDEGAPSPSPSPTPAPTATPLLTPTPTATPLLTPTPTPPPDNVAWVARYRGPAGGADWVYDLTVDGSGNVYVTGKSFSRQPYDYSYATVKYDSEGNELWVARYDGPGGDDDVSQAIAVDISGNVYVTGKSYNGLHYDYAYATVKYDSDGNELWAARYDGPGEGDDEARAIAVDAWGNVYVTGCSGGDYATVKYDGDGNELWVARYDGPAGGEDGAVAVAVDDSGKVYVTGSSGGDYATLKYDSEGNRLWVARYEGEARAMVVDDSGNVYVTGKSQYKYATVKYDSDGNELWVGGCYGPACGDGGAVAIALDGWGNVYATGQSYSSRTLTYGYATVKYDSDGRQLWVARYDEGASGQGVAIVADSSGNVYITGEVWGEYRNYYYDTVDCFTVSYDGDGNELWVAAYDGPAGGEDRGVAIAVDAWGNVYVAGKSDGGTTCADYATIKYVSRDSAP